MSDRRGVLPPHDPQAEASLLGCILLRSSLLRDIASLVMIEDFYRPLHQGLYAAMLDLHDKGLPIDTISLRDPLVRWTVDNSEETISMELNSIIQATPAISAWKRYADIVIDASRRRAMIKRFSELAGMCFERGNDVDEILGQSDVALDRIVAPRDLTIHGLSTAFEFMMNEEKVNDAPWLIPHLLKPRWRVIIVAFEGIGKAVFMRFLAVHAAAGRDPWNPSKAVAPRRVLYVDVENAESSITHQLRIANTMHGMDLIAESGSNLHIWHRDGGLNLRSRRDLALFEQVLERTQPEIVFAGPLYKMFRREAREDMEQSTIEFVQTLDDLRTRFGFAIVLEHHAPKGQSGALRDPVPFGSSALLRWPEFGLTLEPNDFIEPDSRAYTLNIGRFRRDRENADWPTSIERRPGAGVPWLPYWRLGREQNLIL